MNTKILIKKASISTSIALSLKNRFLTKSAEEPNYSGSDLDPNPSILKNLRNTALHNDFFFEDGNYLNAGLYGAGAGGIIGALVNAARGKNILTGALIGAGTGGALGAGGKYLSDNYLKPELLKGWQADVKNDSKIVHPTWGEPEFKENGRDYWYPNKPKPIITTKPTTSTSTTAPVAASTHKSIIPVNTTGAINIMPVSAPSGEAVFEAQHNELLAKEKEEIAAEHRRAHWQATNEMQRYKQEQDLQKQKEQEELEAAELEHRALVEQERIRKQQKDSREIRNFIRLGKRSIPYANQGLDWVNNKLEQMGRDLEFDQEHNEGIEEERRAIEKEHQEAYENATNDLIRYRQTVYATPPKFSFDRKGKGRYSTLLGAAEPLTDNEKRLINLYEKIIQSNNNNNLSQEDKNTYNFLKERKKFTQEGLNNQAATALQVHNELDQLAKKFATNDMDSEEYRRYMSLRDEWKNIFGSTYINPYTENKTPIRYMYHRGKGGIDYLEKAKKEKPKPQRPEGPAISILALDPKEKDESTLENKFRMALDASAKEYADIERNEENTSKFKDPFDNTIDLNEMAKQIALSRYADLMREYKNRTGKNYINPYIIQPQFDELDQLAKKFGTNDMDSEEYKKYLSLLDLWKNTFGYDYDNPYIVKQVPRSKTY